ncbi:TNF receptor-associated factor 1b [Glycine max]|nr:TNF receptor-associated factor 1b [Glycine max]
MWGLRADFGFFFFCVVLIQLASKKSVSEVFIDQGMAGTVSEESGVGKSVESISTGQRCQSGEALAEWRSSEQVENGIASTSPPYWDTDDEDDGPKPSALYGRYTWKIEKFSQITKRELRSSAFEVGGYKWYILIYPQGCDVCNHLSLFLCVANHDKLLPGWSHFAQFTIAVVNKDPKKSKYSDTLHRFWKKEHDWGWKKFMELSKVYDGFVDSSDNLIIKAQVQVIREKSDRPFRCLDCQYRRELVRVYLTNVEQICRRFVEERRSKLGKLIEDKARWSSFFTFWREIDQTSRHHMSREKTDVILKVVVKHFFIEKEVTSTLVMDSLFSGLKALEGQTKSKKGRVKLLDAEEIPAPIVHVEKDMFVLVDDVLLLLERAAIEPLSPKDEKCPQNRTKDGNSGEDFNKDSIERDERRLTELGRRTLEIFVLAHIFRSHGDHSQHRNSARKLETGNDEVSRHIINDGEWAEVTHRRNKIKAVSRTQPRTKTHQRSDGTVSWRNKADVTTFYFCRFPSWVTEKDLWQTFQKWGKVWEVFIPKSKNKGGHRFGFVRFKEVADELGLERHLDNNIFFDGMKMFVNRPKFQRGRVVSSHHNHNTRRGTDSIKGVDRCSYGAHVVNVNGGRIRSYAEVVRMSSPGASILCNQTSAFPQPPKDGMRPMVINTNTEQKECIQRAWVARLKNRGMFDRVEEEFKWTIDPDVTPCYWGDDWIIFLNLQDTKANQLLNEESTNGSTPILDLQKWSKDIRPTHRMAWVLLWGLLPHAWEPEYMGQVVADMGEMVEAHEMVEQRRRIDVAKILIRTKMKPGIQTELKVVVDGVEHVVHVVEDLTGIGDTQSLKQPVTWFPPSLFSTEPNSPATVGVDTLGADSTCVLSDGSPDAGDGGFSINGKQPQPFQTPRDQWLKTSGWRRLDRSFSDNVHADDPRGDSNASNSYTTVGVDVQNDNGQTLLKRKAFNAMFQGDRRDTTHFRANPVNRPMGPNQEQHRHPPMEASAEVAPEGQQEKQSSQPVNEPSSGQPVNRDGIPLSHPKSRLEKEDMGLGHLGPNTNVATRFYVRRKERGDYTRQAHTIPKSDLDPPSPTKLTPNHKRNIIEGQTSKAYTMVSFSNYQDNNPDQFNPHTLQNQCDLAKQMGLTHGEDIQRMMHDMEIRDKKVERRVKGANFLMLDGKWTVDDQRVSQQERISASQRNAATSDIYEFNEWISELELQDIRCYGSSFTWFRPNGSAKSRLDRFLVSDSWLCLWPDTSQHVLHRDFSDHCPIILKTKMVDWGPKPFRVVDCWLKHKGYHSMVKEAWSADHQGGWGAVALKNKLRNLRLPIKQWCKDKGDIKAIRIQNLKQKLCDMETLASNRTLSDLEVKTKRALQQELWDISTAYESLLRQKSRAKWIKEGDSNSAYFHKIINFRRSSNAVHGFLIEGAWVQQPNLVKTEAANFFLQRFTEQNTARPTLDGVYFPTIDQNQSQGLIAPFSDLELKDAVWGCDGDKCPGPDASWDNVLVLKSMLRGFEMASGLKINFAKSQFGAVGVQANWVQAAAAFLNCRHMDTPFKYLGMPIGVKPSSRMVWEPLINKFEAKLSKWNQKNLSMGGKITLIKSVLNALPIYLLSFFKIPQSIVDKLESLQRNFMWGDNHHHKKISWVKWEVVCLPKSEGGLGIKNLSKFNAALRGKWIWDLVSNHNQLWGRVLISKYGGWSDLKWGRDKGWQSQWWKDLRKLFHQPDFNIIQQNMAWKVGCGDQIKFWQDTWLGEGCTLQQKYNPLYIISRQQHLSISKMGKFSQGAWIWDLKWRRHLFDHEHELAIAFMDDISAMPIQQHLQDSMLWKAEPNGLYSTKSAYRLLMSSISPVPHRDILQNLWKLKIPPRAAVFSWRLLLDRLPTRANLLRRNVHIQDTLCPLCGTHQEEAGHLFFHCKMTRGMWGESMNWIRAIGALSADPASHFIQFCNGFGAGSKHSRVCGWWIALSLTIWQHRNSLIFKGTPFDPHRVMDEALFLAWSWGLCGLLLCWDLFCWDLFLEGGTIDVLYYFLKYLCNKIEVAYQEAVALKRQEELIREEEAAWQAESDQKTKRGSEREKKSKKKQAKQKRNNRKGKDKEREERTAASVPDKNQDNAVDEKNDSKMEEAQAVSEKPDAMEDVSDMSDSVDGVAETLQLDSEDRDASPVNWDTDASEVNPPTKARNNGIDDVSTMQNGISEKRSSSVIDDSSSTCSTDSLPSVVMNDPHKGNSFSNYKVQKSPSRGKNRGKTSSDVGSWTNEIDSQPSGSAADAGDFNDESGNGKIGKSESEVAVISLQDRLKWAEKHVVRKINHGKKDVYPFHLVSIT